MQRAEKKRKKHEERLRRLENKKGLDNLSGTTNPDDNDDIDVVGDDMEDSESRHGDDEDSGSEHEDDEKPILRSPFSIDSLLEAPKVPRGRRPNSKYPRVQASKSMHPLSLGGMVPLFPITQPVGFQVERIPTPPVRSSVAEVNAPLTPSRSPSSTAAADCKRVIVVSPIEKFDQNRNSSIDQSPTSFESHVTDDEPLKLTIN